MKKMLKIYMVILMLFGIDMICSAGVIVSGGVENDIAGRMCRTADGRLIAIIERNSDWGSGNFFATFSDDEGVTWSALDTVVFQSGNQSSHSVVYANDRIYLFYASNESGNYKIYSIESVDGMNWNNKTLIDLGWTSSQSVYDPIVILEEDGALTMSYISMSHGAYVAKCPAFGVWDHEKNQIMSGAYRVRICKHLDGTYMAAYHRNISGNYDIHVRSSMDLVTWSDELDMTSNGNSHDAYCNVSPDGIYYLYYAKNTSGIYNICRKYSADGINWSEEENMTSDFSSNTQPSIFFDHNLLHLMWTHAIDYDTDNDVYYENTAYINTGSQTIKHPQAIELKAYSYHQKLIVDIQGVENQSYLVSIITSNGQVLQSKPLPKNESSLIFEKIPTGLYIIRVMSGKSRKTIKAVVN